MLDTNFLVLDEPTNHLDLKTKSIFQDALINYNGTVVIVSHDRYFLDRLVNKVFELKDGAINYYSGNYSYFIEKRTEFICMKEDKSRLLEREPAFKSKVQKRLEAEERNSLAKTKNAWKKELAAVEKKIELLEARKTELETALCNPQIHKDVNRIKIINKELKGMNSELDHSYTAWTKINSQLDQLDIVNAENSSSQH